MERTLTTTAILPSATALPGRAGLLRRLAPLWRHAAFSLALFGVVGTGAFVRLDVQRLRKDLDRSARAILEARVLNDRLGLEMEARRRAVAMEHAALSLGLGPQARLEVVDLPGVTP